MKNKLTVNENENAGNNQQVSICEKMKRVNTSGPNWRMRGKNVNFKLQRSGRENICGKIETRNTMRISCRYHVADGLMGTERENSNKGM